MKNEFQLSMLISLTLLLASLLIASAAVTAQQHQGERGSVNEQSRERVEMEADQKRERVEMEADQKRERVEAQQKRERMEMEADQKRERAEMEAERKQAAPAPGKGEMMEGEGDKEEKTRRRWWEFWK